MINGNIDLLVKEILDCHKNKTLRSYRDYNECAFHAGFEVLLRSLSIRFISEIQLIKNYKSRFDCDKIDFGFGDIFIFDNDVGNDSILIELKLINLVGLYSGDVGRWIKHPEHEKLNDFDRRLKVESEDAILNRNYFYWDKDE